MQMPHFCLKDEPTAATAAATTSPGLRGAPGPASQGGAIFSLGARARHHHTPARFRTFFIGAKCCRRLARAGGLLMILPNHFKTLLAAPRAPPARAQLACVCGRERAGARRRAPKAQRKLVQVAGRSRRQD